MYAWYATEADINRKLPCEAYNSVSMPSLQGRFHVKGSPRNSTPLKLKINTAAKRACVGPSCVGLQ